VASHVVRVLWDKNLGLVESGRSFHLHDAYHLLNHLYRNTTYCFPALLVFHVALLLFVYHVQLDVAFAASAVLVVAVVAGVNRLVLDDCEGPLEAIDDAQG